MHWICASVVDVASLRDYSGSLFTECPQLLEKTLPPERKSDHVRTELLAGATTFATMAYVVVVNPQSFPKQACRWREFSSLPASPPAIATLIMGLWANYPIALAPGMSLNAYFTYSIVIGRGVPWQPRWAWCCSPDYYSSR